MVESTVDQMDSLLVARLALKSAVATVCEKVFS